ncbi:MAG: M48 family metallopeptidase [Candidatus Marinimicrobia bacterium]|nr:M48 family metallopeptidase [Candidatus Neomarinimicrobiota bacterium]
MNIYLDIIIGALILQFFLHNLSSYLDLKNLSSKLHDEFKGHYSESEYARSQAYIRENTRFSYLTSSFDLLLILLVILLGLFNNVDVWINSFGFSPIVTGLVFFGVLFLIQDIISTPFSLYRTFIIEENYGFNKTTPKTYLLDKIKSYILLIIIGGLILSLILFFFNKFGDFAWLYAWIVLSAFLVLIQPLFTLFIAPLFNTFTPLEDGRLKDKINDFAQKVNFPISRIDVMDGSRRSSKSNAYFSGLGKNKRIALFDTLIENHSEDELLSIIAHEVGHYKKKHNIKGIIMGVIQTGIMFFLLSLFLNNESLFAAFKMENVSIYASLLFFSILYSPIELIMSFVVNAISRKHEFEADAFAKTSVGTGKYLIEGLKKLTVTNLGNLTPHALTVWLGYSHPPVLSRIKALNDSKK